MNVKHLPNYPALQKLYRQYHAVSGTASQVDSSHVSSHWQTYGLASRIEIDSEGNLVGLEGAGFGSYRHERMLRRLADYICCAIHFLWMDNKKEIVALMNAALSLVNRIPFGCHYLSYDLFRQVHALATIRQHFHSCEDERFAILVIGDGFGFLTALMKAIYPQVSIVLVDLGRTLTFQCLYVQILYPWHVHEIVSEDMRDFDQIKKADFLYCPAERLELLEDFRWRLAVNICSMQEMTAREIERYFRYLRGHAEEEAMFYCCNRESKVLPDGEKVEFTNYPWLATDRCLLDGRPSVYDFWFSTRRNRNGPKFWRMNIPFVDGPDGPIRHRLTMLSPSN